MWTIIKFDKKKLGSLKEDLKKKLDKDLIFYTPKLLIQKYKNNKIIQKEYDLLGDYIFCFHKSFKDTKKIQELKFSRGLKYFLGGFIQSQNEIRNFVEKCKESENKEGYLSKNFLELHVNSIYKFSSGPFAEMIFKILNLHKNKINILLGNFKTTIKRNDFLFTQV